MFKKILIVLCLSLVLIIGLVATSGGVVGVAIVYARSGCCSGRGGVCGCGCCDGTPLSAVCRPYYPECGVEVDSFGHDRAQMKPSKNGTNGDDRHILSQDKEDWGWADGWELAVVYAVGVCLVVIFAKMRHRVRNKKS